MTPIDVGNGLRFKLCPMPSGRALVAYEGVTRGLDAEQHAAWVRWCDFSASMIDEEFTHSTEQAAIDAIEAFREMEKRK